MVVIISVQTHLRIFHIVLNPVHVIRDSRVGLEKYWYVQSLFRVLVDYLIRNVLSIFHENIEPAFPVDNS